MPTKARDAFRTISEVADWLDVPAHVLRFWESKFSQIKPVKRAGGRRYYRPEDMELIGGIKRLLHDDGMTIRGVQKMLKEDGVKTVSALSPSLDSVDDAASPRTQQRKADVPDVEDAPIIADKTTAPTEEEDTVAEWQADSVADTPPAAVEERPPLNISMPSEPEEEPLEVADAAPEKPQEVEEAPFIDVPEEPEQLGGDNVVNLNGRAEPEEDAEVEEPEALAEPLEAQPEPETVQEPVPEAAAKTRETTLPPSEPTPAPVQLDQNREKTLPPTVTPTPEAEPIAAEAPSEPEATPSEGFKLSPLQLKALALKVKLRSKDPSKLSADPAVAAQLDRLRALRDRIASARNG